MANCVLVTTALIAFVFLAASPRKTQAAQHLAEAGGRCFSPSWGQET